MTYGSATTSDFVRPFFTSIYGDKVREETLAEFERRYSEIGSSPLISITAKQASLLESKLGSKYVVRSGMRHGEPSIEKAVGECKQGDVTRIVGIILSPQYSSVIMGGYDTALHAGGFAHGFEQNAIAISRPWPAEPHFIQFVANSVEEKLKILGDDTPVVFTTHSMPKRVIDTDPGYLGQLQTTINTILNLLPRTLSWHAGYQSAGHSPEEWLKPDLTDILKTLHEKNATKVLIVPIQFISDHLEVLYDLDIAAKKQCDDFNIAYNRIELPNTSPLFIETLAKIARNS
jgi:ferrochelatase